MRVGTNAVDFLYLSWLGLNQTTLSKMSVGPIERLGSEKLPEGVSSEGSKMSQVCTSRCAL